MKKIIILFAILMFQNSFGAFLPNSFQANFEQSFISKIRKRIKKSHGVIKYLYPSNVHFEVKTPSPVLFVTNKQNSWKYNPPFDSEDKGTVQEFKSDKLGFSKIFDVLKGGLVNNEVYKVDRSKNTAILKFNQNFISNTNIAKIKMIFNDSKVISFENIEKMILIYSDKKEITLKFTKFNKNKKFSKNQFVFSPPKNTETIK